MNSLMNYLGTAAGLIGVIVCAVAGLTRLSGSYYLFDYETTSVFIAGTGFMVFACLLKLEVLLRKGA